jgi:hypothetical protein
VQNNGVLNGRTLEDEKFGERERAALTLELGGIENVMGGQEMSGTDRFIDESFSLFLSEYLIVP